jgi:hypothetical protein
MLQSLRLAIDIACIGVHSICKSECVLVRRNAVAAFKKIRKVDVTAAKLVHHIGRVAEAVVGVEHQRIAERKCVALLGQLVRLQRDCAIELVGV